MNRWATFSSSLPGRSTFTRSHPMYSSTSKAEIAIELMASMGYRPDPWQVQVLEMVQRRLLLNCCRQSGKSTVAAYLGLFEAIVRPMTRVLLVSRSHRQARELFRTVCYFHTLLEERKKKRRTQDELELENMSRIVCVPCR